MIPSLIAVTLTFLGMAAPQDMPHAGLLRNPDVSATHIVFGYANDLWVVDREGGMAMPLASPAGREATPKFSADGSKVAFLGNYEGNRDLYTVPTRGGAVHRVTHHSADEVLCDWTADGRLLYFSNGLAPLRRMTQLFLVSPDGGLPERLPVPYGAMGSISADGQWLAYTLHTRDTRTWKRYQGGMATDLWLFHLGNHAARRITDWAGTDTQPMWLGSQLYYLSDAGPEHRLNLWRFDPATNAHTQVTLFKDFDVKWPSLGPGPDGKGEIVCQLGPQLVLISLADATWRPVKVTIPGDRAALLPTHLDAAARIQSWDLSPTGKRAVVQARGDVWTLPAEHGSPRRLTATPGVAERDPAWSPDGRWVSWFSDASGEYELYVAQSDGKGEARQVTKGGHAYLFQPSWSPDSKHLAFSQNTGELRLVTVESGEDRVLDVNPTGQPVGVNWSPDSAWLTWSHPGTTYQNAIFLCRVADGSVHQVTSGMFDAQSPVFDRAGDHLFFLSTSEFQPTYSEIDSTFIYRRGNVLVGVPLREDVSWPWPVKSDEETWAKDGDEAGTADKDKDEESEAEGSEDSAPSSVVSDDGISGRWEGMLSGGPLPNPAPLTLTLVLNADGSVTGSASTPMGGASVNGTLDRQSGDFRGQIVDEDGMTFVIEARLTGQEMKGTATAQGTPLMFEFTARRTAPQGQEGEAAADEDAKGDAKKKEPVKPVEILLEGFESRAFALPVPSGTLRALSINDQGALLYVRAEDDGNSLRLFDLKDEKKQEQTVATGVGGYALSADGKKVLLIRGSSATIQDTRPGATGKNVVTAGMDITVDLRQEWQQVFRDAWRIFREYFYDPGMHGVDWAAQYEHYAPMIGFCSSREDVNDVIGELIAELNVGHAYVGRGSPDREDVPSLSVGVLGADFALHDGAYQFTRIFEGAPWDTDARNPLRQEGVAVKEGDYLLAVNGTPVDVAQDPWAAFQGLAGQVTTLTVHERPAFDGEEREVLVTPMASDADLRYRAWIEGNRRKVLELSDGKVGYLYVPDTGRGGQNDLFRQFYGQAHMQALLIDDRWNGGGQIPTRFIELLNRPATNYWAVRAGRDWMWPPDSHQGPKAMLINGLAGSGGDAFPHYFRQAGLGKLIGMRTWGGLVGLSGNPGLIDGGGVNVPTFGFYENDGTWGIEGHGVDPDMEIVDDPSRMQDGGDPQLEAGVRYLLDELARNPYTPPRRPPYPDRSGMGIPERDH